MDFAMKECAGCTTCEIACSYKHNDEFNPALSSIEIIQNQEAPGYKVRLIIDSSTGRIPCNGCKDLDGDPMCMMYCHKRDDLKVIIDQFIISCLDGKEGRD
jgi:Fe-S-cluster-containing dehydrogenase component